MWAGFNAKALKFPEQGVPVETEEPGRFSLIPLDLLENIEDLLFFEVTPGLTQAQAGLLDILDHVPPQDGDVQGQLP